MHEVVTVGETMVLLTAPEHYGKLKQAPVLQKQIGGAESNVMVALARLGHHTAWISRVGADPFGEEIMYRLRGEGVDTRHVLVDAQHRTGMMLKQRQQGSDPHVFYYRQHSAASHLHPSDLPEKVIASARILHVTGIMPALSQSCRDTVFAAVGLAKQHGVKVSVDPNLRLKLWSIEEARPVLLELIRQADYFFPGVEEARLLLEEPDCAVDDLIARFLEMGAGRVIMKLGSEGSITADAASASLVTGIQVTEVDSVGAGDGFCAGYLSGVLRGLPPQECARRANIVGALAVTDPSDYGGYPTEEELNASLQRSKLTR
ncbi:sugar kinase [Ectobacillus ponti]|uniref:Sugar kinase n=1 Tax=Ectobacillus ponti TaxID=2961894 RepID=A0AA41X6F9_9BACI|nr:sugar kinase [Ectobacillus ponti]MCP8969677.1 sugar kinase [Ectobacillus ponti]